MRLWVIGVVVLCSVMGGIAQILLKKGSNQFAPEQLLHNYWLFAGLALYGISFLLYIFMLRFEKVTILYPIISLSYIWVMMLAAIFLAEPITFKKMVGSLIIIGGVMLIAG